MKNLVSVWASKVARLAAHGFLATCLTVIAISVYAYDSDRSSAIDAPAATATSLRLSQLQRTLLTAKDGVPSTIYAITQDRDGYLWLGGPTGVFRFDGVNVIPMFKGQLKPDIITALYGDNDGDLWIGSLHGKVSRVHNGVVEQVGREVSKSTIMSFKQMADGTLWVVASSRIDKFAHGTWRRAGIADGLNAKFVWVTGTGVDGSYWIFAADGAYRLRPGAQHFEHASADEGIVAMAHLPATAVYPKSGVTADLIVDKAGALWVPTNGKLARLSVGDIADEKHLVTENVESSDHHPDIQVTADYSDRQGNVWVATPEGLALFRSTRFVPLTLPEPVFWPAMVEDSHHALWVASNSAAPPMQIDDAVTRHPEIGGVTLCVANDPDGSVWFSGDKGIQRYSQGQLSAIPSPPAIGPQASLANPRQDCSDMRVASDGSLWISMRFTGVSRWDGHAWSKITPEMATSIQFEGDKTWLAFVTNKLLLIENGKTTTYSPQSGLDLITPRRLYVGQSGLWITGDDGIEVKTGSQFLRLIGNGGERFENTRDLVQLANGDIWFVSARGLYRVSAAELQSALAATHHAVAYTLFDESDGVENAKNLLASSDGRLWVSMRQGVAWIDALHMPTAPAAPRVSIESINDHDVRDAGTQVTSLEKGTRTVNIVYTAATLLTPTKAHFRYRLKGVDEEWQTASDRREAHYANLGPGHYTFHVEASNADGVWSEQPTKLPFEILPEFYQTWWFKVLCAALVLAALWLLYLTRIRQIYAQLDARTRERENMARDFHDTILQNFQSLLLHVQLAVRSVPDGAAKEKLDKALDVTENALNEGRDKIGELRSLAEPVEELSSDIARLANRLSETYPTLFSMHVEGERRPLNTSAAKDVHAIVGELVTNAFRHAQAHAMHVELRYGKRELHITVTDDGCGTDVSALLAGKTGHWGLKGIQERAARVGGRFTLGTAPSGKGTRATLKIPGRFVYAGKRWFR